MKQQLIVVGITHAENMVLLDKFGEYFIGDFFDQSLALLFQNPLQNLELNYKL